MNQLTYILITISILFNFSCKTNTNVNLQNTSKLNRDLNENEVKFIYHESVRRILNNNVIGFSLSTIQDFYDESIRLNCGGTDLEFLVFSQPNNMYISTTLKEVGIKLEYSINSSYYLKSISFNAQPKMKVSHKHARPVYLHPPYLGYIEFSDIFRGENKKYYIEISLHEKLLCEDNKDRRWHSNIIFEIERCQSGLLTFSRMFGGIGDKKFINCPDSYNCR